MGYHILRLERFSQQTFTVPWLTLTNCLVNLELWNVNVRSENISNSGTLQWAIQTIFPISNNYFLDIYDPVPLGTYSGLFTIQNRPDPTVAASAAPTALGSNATGKFKGRIILTRSDSKYNTRKNNSLPSGDAIGGDIGGKLGTALIL